MAKRIGYVALLVAIVAFVAGAVGRFTESIVTAVATAFIVCTLTLLPGTIVNYGVRSANREDRRRAAAQAQQR